MRKGVQGLTILIVLMLVLIAGLIFYAATSDTIQSALTGITDLVSITGEKESDIKNDVEDTLEEGMKQAKKGASSGSAGSGDVSDSSSITVGEKFVEEDFEKDNWQQWFTSQYQPEGWEASISSNEAKEGGSSLRVRIPRGDHRGIKTEIDPKEAGLVEENLQELYVSYWVKFGSEFQSNQNGGKLPGPQNRERNDGGAANEPANGNNGWGAHGKFGANDDGIIIGYYTYHMDMSGSYGDHLPDPPKTFSRGEWHHVEQYVKLNTVSNGNANKDGELKLWVNGETVVDRTNMRFTLHPENGINYDFLVYYGGKNTSPSDNEIYFDNFVLGIPE